MLRVYCRNRNLITAVQGFQDTVTDRVVTSEARLTRATIIARIDQFHEYSHTKIGFITDVI